MNAELLSSSGIPTPSVNNAARMVSEKTAETQQISAPA
jgi:hypothetical protein